MRWPQRVAAMLLTAVLLVGPPILLVRLVGWPTTDTPRVALWQWVRDPLTEQNLTLMLVVAAWALWAFIAYLVTATTATRLWAGVRWLRHLPLPTPWQATATGIAGAAALTITTPTTPTAETDHPAAATGTSNTHHHDDTAHADSADGIAVPGGWLPRDIADQVTAAAGLIWIRRRRTYRPNPAPQATRADSDLTPLPATVTAIQAATAADPAPTPVEPQPLAVLPSGLHPEGAVLAGPGALAAARGLLVTVLLAAPRHHTPQLVITRRAAEKLLGPAAHHLQPGPDLRIADHNEHAATLLPPPAPTEQRPGKPQALLITETPPTGPLADALTAGTTTPIILTPWPAAPTWHVDTEGHTHNPRDMSTTGPRVCVLDPTAAADLLTITGHLPPPPPSSNPAPQPRVPHQTSTHRAPEDTITPLQVRVLGEPALLINGTPLRLRRSAAQQALVFLAVHPNGTDSRHIAEALWPGMPAHRLTGRLYTTLSELRTATRTITHGTLIDRTDDRYRLNPTLVQVDLWQFHAAVEHATTTLTAPRAAWQAVVDAYTADLAHGRTWPWLDPHRETIRRTVLDAYAALAAAEPDPKRALAHLQDGLRVDPYNADLHQRTVATLHTLGEHTAATDLADRYHRRLAAVGIDDARIPSGNNLS
ncbi:hypothetical protein SAMN05216284_114121 [Micromonospora sediminimaris]|uniref:Bacterial transcriptional activator domain-containing protein n=2 Tax=Micromonospora sediminimaris TaxID=547162 RepID=A0A9W5UTX1_9ACTN|nr:hypothetical protein Vse01_36290 [Micromonospora sediminimaris]SFD29365.1 hypothetical protein SAMN05216284_114121 [Micromonospora sediminimaris]